MTRPGGPKCGVEAATSTGYGARAVLRRVSNRCARRIGLRREGDTVVRISDTGFGPSDDFCTLWHFFDLLPGGVGEWSSTAKKSSCCSGA